MSALASLAQEVRRVANTQRLFQGVLTGTANDLLVTAGVDPIIITRIVAVNNAVAGRTLKLWQGDNAATPNILPVVTIEAGGWAEDDGDVVLNPGDTLYARASAASSITLTVYGKVGD